MEKSKTHVFFSDAHGNYDAYIMIYELTKIYPDLDLYYLGDAIGYIPDLRVIDDLMNRGITYIMGNHEEMYLKDYVDINLSTQEIYNYHYFKKELRKQHIDFIKSLPTNMTINVLDKSVFICHGGPKDVTNQYIYPDSECTLIDFDHDLLITAHTHRPFIKKSGNKIVANVGSCGLPRDDGRYGSYIIICEKSREIRLMRYNLSETTKKIKMKYTLDERILSVFNRSKFNTIELEIFEEVKFSI